MFQALNDQTIMIFPLFMGGLALLLALLNEKLLRFIGLKPLSKLFTTPLFQRSAKITEKLGRLFLVVIGVSFLVQGVGPLFLPDEVLLDVVKASVGVAILIVLAMVGVVLAHRKAQ